MPSKQDIEDIEYFVKELLTVEPDEFKANMRCVATTLRRHHDKAGDADVTSHDYIDAELKKYYDGTHRDDSPRSSAPAPSCVYEIILAAATLTIAAVSAFVIAKSL